MKSFLMSILLLVQLLLGGCADAGKFDRPRSLSSLKDPKVSVYAERYTGENSAHKTGSILTDSAAVDELWEIISAQEECAETEGTNYLPGTPRLILTDKYGRKYTVSYTWCSEEYGTDPLDGAPTVSHSGECFLIRGDKLTKRYEVKDSNTRNRFEQLILDALGEEQPQEKSRESDAIVFVSCYSNFAWESIIEGCFVDIHGDVYGFDFSGSDLLSDDEDFAAALWEVYCSAVPIRRGAADENELAAVLLDDIPSINRNAEVIDENVACDMGQKTLYALDEDMRLTELRSTGDNERQLNDETAKRLCDYFDRIME